jgi:translation initiation factor IF-1
VIDDRAGGRPAHIEVTGTVRELLPSALCRVAIDGHRDVIAHAEAGPQRNFVRLIVGDRVVVRLSPHDPGRGRIVRRLPREGIRE